MDRRESILQFIDAMHAIKRLAFSKHDHAGLPTRAQMGILYAVSIHHESSIKDLAGRFSMSSSAVTQLVDSLVKEGLLEREEHALDRRKLNIVLTDKGKTKLYEARNAHAESLTKIFEPLTDQELEFILTLQEKIRKNLE